MKNENVISDSGDENESIVVQKVLLVLSIFVPFMFIRYSDMDIEKRNDLLHVLIYIYGFIFNFFFTLYCILIVIL